MATNCVVENGEADIVLHQGQGGGRHAQFQVIDKESCATERKSGDRVARASLVQTETAMRVSTSGEEPFRQRDQLVIVHVLSRLGHNGIAERIFDSDSC